MWHTKRYSYIYALYYFLLYTDRQRGGGVGRDRGEGEAGRGRDRDSEVEGHSDKQGKDE